MWKLARRTTRFMPSVFNNNLKVLSKIQTRGIVCKNPRYQQVSSFHFGKIHSNGDLKDWNHSSGAVHNTKKAKQLIRSKFKDVMVKAGEDIYYLDRVKLAQKSDYFEKLLVHYGNEEIRDPIEIPVDSDTFSALLDAIYDKRSWDSLLNWDNFVSVLMAKDFLQINDKYDCSEIYNYLSKNLEKLSKREEFLSLPFDHFIKTLECDRTRYDDVIGEICTKWICHDLKNRLPHLAKVANAARRRMRFLSVLEEGSVEVKLSDIDEQTKYEVVGRYIDRLLRFPNHNQTVNELRAADRGEDSYFPKSSESSSQTKMKEYLRNGTFYDITVRVDGKTYKLHRCILQSKSAYFEELFSTEYRKATAQCEGVPDLPNKDEEYSIEGIDQATFDLLIDYIYLKKRIELSSNNIVPILKAVDILGIEDLLWQCQSEVKRCIGDDDFKDPIRNLKAVLYYLGGKKEQEKRCNGELDSKDPSLMALLDYLRGKKQHEKLYMSYLIKHGGKFWSDEAHKGEFFSMSFDTLEHLLQSPKFHLDDPQEMLDMCSKWIMQDVKNRYHLIPRIALGINSYGLPDYKDYKMEIPSDLANCTEQSIRDKIWEIISSTSLIPVDTKPNKEPKKFEELPLFIASTCESYLDDDDPNFFVAEILNGNFDRLATLSFTKKCRLYTCYNRLSATLIGDNLFLYCWLHGAHFMVYNLPSSKLITLNADSRMESRDDMVAGLKMNNDRILLNCHDEVYCCSSNGPVLKYSPALNRWMLFSKAEPDKEKMEFTSDGKKLYRMYVLKNDESSSSRHVEVYSFEQNAWISLPDLPPRWRAGHSPVDFTIIHGHDPAILFKRAILWFDSSSQTWRKIPLASGQKWSEYKRNHSVIAQGEPEILHVFGKKLYQYSKSNEKWELKKEIPEKLSGFINIVAVNRPANSAVQDLRTGGATGEKSS